MECGSKVNDKYPSFNKTEYSSGGADQDGPSAVMQFSMIRSN